MNQKDFDLDFTDWWNDFVKRYPEEAGELDATRRAGKHLEDAVNKERMDAREEQVSDK